ncbi:MAG: restriction endonuclease [Proteobacteria bacterium]|nr:restriction endonuclease [Pseudomonadota bacterium]MBU1738849.1 restriction endonuclease [Pseudomonadota bacterium]
MISSEILAKLTLPLFVDVCRAFFGQMGFEAKETDFGAGQDLSRVNILYNKKTNAPLSLFQCYAGNSPVGLEMISRFDDVMGAVNMTSGYFLNLGHCSEDVRSYAAANRINLVDVNKLAELINKLPEAGRDLIDEIAGQGQKGAVDTVLQAAAGNVPGCAKCGFRMQLRITEGKYREGKYWECPNPDCRYIIAFSEELD